MALDVAEALNKLRALESEAAQQLQHHHEGEPTLAPSAFGRDFQAKGHALIKLFARLHRANLERYQHLERATGLAHAEVDNAQQAEEQNAEVLRGVR
ncbi:hypothetical protein [Corynebacterium gerontici]|uniref:FlgN protein n=1 Tax=Corynebacterium gerontici TaxID=2079234 RepID=A0A3G6J275_9CORY|nr:hypothetical protein [Corynebacterium gerontici]AZA12042.1 hypothetical protein CGERO_08755 [Corynebacterium gerontici]